MDSHHKVLIIGAGPAGLAAATELAREKEDFLVVEKNGCVGGLSKTYVIDEDGLEFRTDNGPHRFFSKNQYLYSFIGEVLGERWIPVKRQTRQFIDGKFFDYPLNAFQILKNVGLARVIELTAGYASAAFRYNLLKKPIKTFYDYAIASFGRPLAEFNILGYTEKIWGISTRELHPDWARQRVKGLNVGALLLDTAKKLIAGRHGKDVKTLIDTFYYPDLGAGTTYEMIREKLEKSGYEVRLNSFPVAVNHDGRHITSVTVKGGGSLFDVHPEYLVESVHITDFVKLLRPEPPAEVLQAAARLRYRSQVYLFITLDREKITDDQWIYFPDPAIPFARISEMRNFSPKMSPSGKTSLFVEFFCDEGDPVYSMTDDQLFEHAMPHFERLGFLKRGEVRKHYTFRGGKDYPIYDLNYPDNLKRARDYLDGFENLYYIGRPGRFKYTNQDHSLEMGILAARSIIDNRRYNFEEVGAETEYFEKGNLLLQPRPEPSGS